MSSLKDLPLYSATALFAVACLSVSGTFAHAEETWSEKAKSHLNDAGRAAKKKIHRAQESMCRKDDVECLKLKAKHRAQEVGEEVQDAAEKIKNKID